MTLFLITSTDALAFIDITNSQLSFRTGMIQGSYSNPIQNAGDIEGDIEGGNIQNNLEDGGFSVMPSLDASFEFFSEPTKSYTVRGTIALDMGTGVMHYNYFGLGRNYYFKGTGLGRVSSGAEGIFKVQPKNRQYYGYSIGMSRVSVVNFGPALAAVSTGIDLGGHWGYIRQMGKSWGLNIETGLSYAYGISTVSSAGMNIKVLFGMSMSL